MDPDSICMRAVPSGAGRTKRESHRTARVYHHKAVTEWHKAVGVLGDGCYAGMSILKH